MGWWYYAFVIVMAVLSYALRPKPKIPNYAAPKPPGIEELQFPTAEAGRAIPVVFGTRWVKAPNVCWYGDLKTDPIEETTCA